VGIDVGEEAGELEGLRDGSYEVTSVEDAEGSADSANDCIDEGHNDK